MSDEPRILVVEDDPSWQGLYEEVLTGRGYLVEPAESLAEALEALDRRFYHVAIVDLRLGQDPKNRDGLKVLEHISELDEGTAAIVVSAYSEVSMFDEFRRYGVFGLAEKPSSIPVETLRELERLKFIKGGIDKGDAPDSIGIIGAVERAMAEAQRSAVQMIWTESPFSFINGIFARDIQHAIGGGHMAELRPLIGDLCRPFMPWLQAKKKPTEIKIGDLCVGFQTPCWSRALGKAIVVRFGRCDSFNEAMNLMPVDTVNNIGEVREELRHASSSHFEGVVHSIVNADFRLHFKPPALKKIVKSTEFAC
jgi:CheY-like chemotaxis protein